MTGPTSAGPTSRGLVLASRGDALTPYLFAAIEQRYPVSARIDPELTRAQRLLVAAPTVRPTRSRWAEQFFKSALGYRLRTSNAARALTGLDPADPVLQVHALFETRAARTLHYVDCTHRQSADLWPAWNPLQGNALRRWYATETRSYRRAEHVFAFSQWTRRSLVEDYGVDPDRVTVVGIGGNFVRPERGARPASTPPTILMVGNDFVRKGGPELLTAFTTVRRDLPDARLVLVGTLPPAGVRIPDGVEVAGRLHDRAAVSDAYAEADVFAMPSRFDPMPLAVLEAMGHSLPVVATRTCGIPDEVEDGVTGHLVAPGDPDELAAALLRTLTSPGRGVDLGRAGRARVQQEFLWEHVVDRMAPVLDRLTQRTHDDTPSGPR
jgi:starch synthase